MAASITPGPPPVATTRSARVSWCARRAASRYGGAPRGTACPPITPTMRAAVHRGQHCAAEHRRCRRRAAAGPAPRDVGQRAAVRREVPEHHRVEHALEPAGRRSRPPGRGRVEAGRRGRVRRLGGRPAPRSRPFRTTSAAARRVREGAAHEEGIGDVHGGQIGWLLIQAKTENRQPADRSGGRGGNRAPRKIRSRTGWRRESTGAGAG